MNSPSQIRRGFLVALVVAFIPESHRAAAQEVLSSTKRAGWSERVPRVEGARERFAGPDGSSKAAGDASSPWDLAWALSGAADLAPGDVLWVRGGTYRGKFEVKLRGREGAPIHVRAVPGERAVILDSGLVVLEPASHVWIWDLEIAGSTPVEKRETSEAGSHPKDLPGTGGLDIYAGKGCKYIHLDIHDNVKGGVGFWSGATDSEIHGCVIHSNGWRGPDRGHGHAIYAQNKDGVKTITNTIMTVPFDGSYTMHAYGSSRAYVDHFTLARNIAWERGPFLIGGGRPSQGIRVHENYLHGIDLRLGYGAENHDCEVRGNVVAKGSLRIEKFRKVVDEENVRELPASRAILIPSDYDPDRAHVAVYNGAKAATVELEVAPFLEPGERFRLLDPKDLSGKPVYEGKVEGKTIAIPVTGEFAPFVLFKIRTGTEKGDG